MEHSIFIILGFLIGLLVGSYLETKWQGYTKHLEKLNE